MPRFPWQGQRPEFPWIDPHDPGEKPPDRPPKLWELILCLIVIGIAVWCLVMLMLTVSVAG